jgi:uncharacterized protein DUF3105
MTLVKKMGWAVLAGSAVVAVGCVAEVSEAEVDEVKTFTLQPGSVADYAFTANADGNVVVTVDCSPPSSPDAVGPVVAVKAADLGLGSFDAAPARAGYFRWAGSVTKGTHPVSLRNDGASSVVCKIGATKQSSTKTCTDWTIHRSPITDAMHIPVGDTESGEWEALPASGNHWGAWAQWYTIYDKPILRGFLLHNLEHGGAVLSYGCASADESDECARARDELVDLALAFGETRLVITPDPSQKQMFAVRTWRWVYSSDCLEQKTALDFLGKHYRHGREDIDADPPVPFDPTVTTDVPCEDLMAAPDSCN